MSTFNVITVPSSTKRQQYIIDLMKQHDIDDWTFVFGKETARRFDGLFDTIKTIVAAHYDQPYVILLEDDVLFTETFSVQALRAIIEDSFIFEPSVLLGGIKEFCFKINKSEPLTKVHNYRGSQMMVIYKRYYDAILNRPSTYNEFEIWTGQNPNINKFVIFPFMAYQADFPSRFLEKDKHKQDYINCENKIKQL